jgi:phage repressor protein C with HTH and peptisase S24 domain
MAGMADMEIDWIKKTLGQQPDKTQGGLAAAMGVSDSAVSNLFSGKRRLKTDELPKIWAYLGQRMVDVVGYVGAGGTAHFFDVNPDELDRIEAPYGATPRTVAVEIRGNSLGSTFNRWLAFYDDLRSPVTEDLIGELCVVRLVDGRTYIKRLQRGKGKKFNLISERDDPMENQEVEWAAKVKSVGPRR